MPGDRRATAFGILSGTASAAFVFGTLSTRFLSTSATFQVQCSSVFFLHFLIRFIYITDSLISQLGCDWSRDVRGGLYAVDASGIGCDRHP